MTNLEFYTTLSALWLALASLPYVLDRVIVRGLIGAMANYDPNAKPQSPWAQRAQRAHKVAVETFVAFGPLAVLASIRLGEDSYPGLLAMTYFYAILAHYVIYCLGIIVLRTAAFVVAMLAVAALALRLLGAI